MEAIDLVAGIPASKTSPWYNPVKRLLDVGIASVMLLAAAPVLAVAGVAIRLEGGGSVIYRRRVVGRGGRPFDALKLRTMVENGDEHIKAEHAEELGNNHKLRRDPRITRVGGLLRKASIDELPQLLNVLKGEMSLVGPRMISFPELEKFGEWQEKILEVKPGITGLWQVSGRSDLEYEDRVRLNVYYVNNRSVFLDLKILAKTIPAVLFARGAW
ncbi:MAG: sugar transferase [Armatimonadota bacterium]